MKAIEQYFHVILLIVLCKVVVASKSVDETLVRGHSMNAIERTVYREVNCLSFMSHAS